MNTAPIASSLGQLSVLPITTPTLHLGGSDSTSCQLFDGFALAVQFLLGSLAMASLLIKRYHEHPRREPLIWFYDVSKQAMGSSFIHILNVGVSSFSRDDTSPSQNPCVWYLLNLLLDTTLGVGVLYLVLKMLNRVFDRMGFSQAVASGYYGKPPQFSIWLSQFSIFFMGLIIMKILVVIIIEIFPSIVELGHFLLSPLEKLGDTRYQIIVVMLLVPLVMNVIQFWLTDQIIKAQSKVSLLSQGISDWQSSDPLLVDERENSSPLCPRANSNFGNRSISPVIPYEEYDVDGSDTISFRLDSKPGSLNSNASSV